MTYYKLMPVAPTQDMLSRVMSIVTGFSGPYGEFNDYLDEETAREVYAAFLADAPDVHGETIRRAIVALERYTYDPLAGRNSARELRELLDAPPAMQEKHSPDNEWIPTNGKKPELPDDTLVDVKFLNGHIEDGNSVNTWKWPQIGESCDITHYRIHQPVSAMQEEPVVSADTKKAINYIVTTKGWSGKKVTECETEDEAWKAIANCSFGALLIVTSPTDKDVSHFIPF